MCYSCDILVQDAYSTAEATDNSAKEKNAESGRQSFQTMGQNHPQMTMSLSLLFFELCPCRKAPAAAPKRDSTSLGARLVEGGPIKKRIETQRFGQTSQVLLLYQCLIPSLTSAVTKQRYTGRRPM